MTIGEFIKRLERFNPELQISVQFCGEYHRETYLVIDKFDLGQVALDRAGNIDKSDDVENGFLWTPKHKWKRSFKGCKDEDNPTPYPGDNVLVLHTEQLQKEYDHDYDY